MASTWPPTILLTIGALSTLLFLKRVLSFVRIYTRPSSISRYHHADAWALVTGASEGIGLALCSELARRGFNVILHGRNPSKLSSIQSGLRKEFPAVEFRIAVADATLLGLDAQARVSAIVHELKGLKLKILINNVGGVPTTVLPRYKTFDETSTKDNDDMLSMNVGFPTQLTAALLPKLLENQPSLIMAFGSMADAGMPYISPYSGCKAFLMAWVRGLRREMLVKGRDVEILGILTGEVTDCAHNKNPATLIMPDAKTYAKAVLDRVGCGHAVVNGYWSQGVLRSVSNWLPEGVWTKALIDSMERVKGEYEKGL